MNAGEILKKMQTGCALHMEFAEGGKAFWLTDKRKRYSVPVPKREAQQLIDLGAIKPCGDGLFEFASQSWVAK